MVRYKMVASKIREGILNGEYVEKLPTEEALMVMFDVSRNTIRSAVDLLVEQAILYRVQGSGVYIREFERDDAINLSLIKSAPAEFNHNRIKTQVLEFQLIKANDLLADEFKLPIGSPVYYFKRLRFRDEQPILLEYSYYNKKVIPHLEIDILKQSVFEYIEHDLNKKIGFADRYVTAQKLSQEEAQLLQLEEHDPTLVNNEKIFLSSGELFSISKVLHHYELTEMYVSAIND